MFSDSKVQELAKEFVCVNLDPRETQDAREFKSTQFIPEVVFLTKDLKVLTRLSDRTVPATVSLMQRVLKKVKSDR